MIVPNSLSPEEIFRLIKNGDCAIFQFQEWLSDHVTYYNTYYNIESSED